MRCLLLLAAILGGCVEPNPFFLHEGPDDEMLEDWAYEDVPEDDEGAEPDQACIGRYDPDCIPQKYRAASNVWPPGHAMGPVVGQQAWVRHACDTCHGATGEGGIGLPLAGVTLSDAYLAWRIREGIPGTLMAAYPEDALTESELWGIVTWLQLTPGP